MRYPEASTQELKAPAGKFRVIGVDVNAAVTANYHLGDFETFSLAEKVAKEKACVGNPVYIYDDKSGLVIRYGSWH
jgi:hypothetical protein